MPEPIVYQLVRLLADHPAGLRPIACQRALTPPPCYSTVMSGLLHLCKRRIVERVAPGCYALRPRWRAAFTTKEAG